MNSTVYKMYTIKFLSFLRNWLIVLSQVLTGGFKLFLASTDYH